MQDVIVVGAGIIGATVANALTRQGKEVLLLDDGRPNSGTPPSGGHLKPSWFGGLKKQEYEPAMDLLKKCWGLEEESFKLWPLGNHVKVYRVNTDVVVQYPRTIGKVTHIGRLDNYPEVVWDGQGVRCRLLVVCTGVWAGELIPGVVVQSKQGVSFRLKGVLPEPVIYPWAPYKQVVAHQQGTNEIWAGDGTAVYPVNWKDRTQQCLARCQKHLQITIPPVRTLTGYRPYCPLENSTDPCLLKQLGPRAWLATGAGKSGTIAAGWVARRILDAHFG